MAMQEFRRTVYALARAYPTIRRGGMNRRQLVDVAGRLAAALGFRLRVGFVAWPWPATVQRVGDTLFITVDSRRHPADQVISLAHEVGHIALGHYHAEPFWADVDGPVQREEDEWADLFAAIVLNKRMAPLDLIGREQMEMF